MTDRVRQTILGLSDQFRPDAIGFADLEKLPKHIDALVVCGMGGSGIPASLLQNIAEYARVNVPVVTWKEFGLPHLSFKNPLFIFVSFSGNTAETLSGFRLAPKNARAVVTTGGVLLEEATKQHVPRAIVPPLDLPPRQGSGIMLYALCGLLKMSLPILDLPDLSKTIQPEPLEKVGSALAKKLKNKIVVVCTPSNTSHLALIFKAHLTETGKTPTFCETYPELNHNGIVGFDSKPKGLVSLFPVSTYESETTNKLISIEQTVLEERGVTPITISIPGTTPLETTANAILLANWTGYYLAKLKGVDPEATEAITEIKAMLKKNGLDNS